MKEGLTTTNIVVKAIDVELAKKRGINLSDLFRKAIHTELYLTEEEGTTKDEQIALLKREIRRLKGQLVLKEDEILELKKSIPKPKESFEI